MASTLAADKFWTEKSRFNTAERQYHESLHKGTASNSQCTLVSEIAKAREHIKNSLEKMDGIATLAASPVSTEVLDRLAAVEKENANLRKMIEKLEAICVDSQKTIAVHYLAFQQLPGGAKATAAAETVAANAGIVSASTTTAAAAAKKPETEDDDGVDLFASDSEEESEDAARVREERLAAYAAKKSKKPALIAKSSLVLDVKPWDDETDLKVMETEIRKITSDGLLWGASKFVPVAFGIQKLSISCVVEDEKVSIDWLTEEIEKLEDFVQSVDVAAFNKI